MLAPAERVILISGANRGIGRAVAQALYEQGYALSLGGRDLASLKAMSADWDETRIHIARYDAQDWATHRAWTDAAVARFGRIDGLVNNAGMHSAITLRAPDEAVLDAIWAVNCKGLSA